MSRFGRTAPVSLVAIGAAVLIVRICRQPSAAVNTTPILTTLSRSRLISTAGLVRGRNTVDDVGVVWHRPKSGSWTCADAQLPQKRQP